MITTDTQESRINVTVLGEFTLADFKEFEDVVMKLESAVDLFIDLREMNGFTVDMALEFHDDLLELLEVGQRELAEHGDVDAAFLGIGGDHRRFPFCADWMPPV